VNRYLLENIWLIARTYNAYVHSIQNYYQSKDMKDIYKNYDDINDSYIKFYIVCKISSSIWLIAQSDI